jgi:hydroxymethylglutaryl-CoA lyase
MSEAVKNQGYKLVECPRDAMQGILQPIPTEEKVRYLQALLDVGFHTLDFGSFVSPKAVPQMADTPEVLASLDLSKTKTHLLAIIANARGAEEAMQHGSIRFLGYPFSISETFQQRNTRAGIGESLELVRQLQAMCVTGGKELVVYISMGFGNPYGDPWSPEIASEWVGEIVSAGVKIVSMADTVGTARQEHIQPLFETLISIYPEVEFGAHFHATPTERVAKLESAFAGGCRRFDSALLGFGGCPFAKDDLVGNIATETLLEWMGGKAISTQLDSDALGNAMQLAQKLFGQYH